MFQLQKAFIVWIAVGVFQASLGADSASKPRAGSSLLGLNLGLLSLGTDSAEDQAYYPPKSQNCCPTCNYNTTSEDFCIGVFVSTFKKAVKSSDDLSKLFGFFSNISAKIFLNGKYPEILKVLIDIGAPNPKFACQQAVLPIGRSFNILTADIVIKVYANVIAKYLSILGILTSQNSVQLGKQYSDMMEEAARSNDSQYTALTEGFFNFLVCLGLFTSDKALLIAVLYGNEWKLAAKLILSIKAIL